MSIDTTHVALANEQQLQQMVGNPDPRISIPAAAKLAKLIQMRNAQAGQQAMGVPSTPTVRDQLHAAITPEPQDSGIAMAAGGVVRHFDGSNGSVPLSMPDVPDTSIYGMVPGTPYSDALTRAESGGHEESDMETAWLKVPRALRDVVRAGTDGIGSAASALGTTIQDVYTEKGSPEKQAAQRIAREHPELAAQLAAKTAPQLPLGIGTQAPTAAQLAAKLASMDAKKPNPKAPKETATPGSGLNAAISTDTLNSGPVNGTKVKAASEGGEDLPEDTHMQRADELIDQLNPLQKERLAQMTASKSDAEARHKALQAAKHDPNKFVDVLNRIVEASRRPDFCCHLGVRMVNGRAD